MLSKYLNKLEELIQQRDFLTFGLLAVGVLMGMLFIRFLFNRVLDYFGLNKTKENKNTINEQTPTVATHPEVDECFDESMKVPEHIKEDLNEPNNSPHIENEDNPIVVMEEININNFDNEPKIQELPDDNNDLNIQQPVIEEQEQQKLQQEPRQELQQEIKQLVIEEQDKEQLQQELQQELQQNVIEEQHPMVEQDELDLDLDLEEVKLNYH